MQLTNIYREHLISFNGNYFEISVEGKTLTTKPKTLEACIAWIDARLKENWVRNPIIVRSYLGETALEATATSVIDSSYLWVTYKENQKREKISKDYCFEISANNLQKFKDIEEITERIALLDKERKNLVNSLEKFDISKMYATKEN